MPIQWQKVTVSALNNDLAQRFGVPLDTMNAAGSSDVLFAKSPAELLQILIRYIPEKLTLERVLLFSRESRMRLCGV